MHVNCRTTQRPLPLAILLACLLAAGCGTGTPTPKAPKVIKSPQAPTNPSAVSSPGPAAAPPANAKAASNTKSQQTKSSNAAGTRAKPDLFADEDPENVFEISGPAPVAEVGASSDAAIRNGFTVGEVLPESNSSRFEVVAASEPSATGGHFIKTTAKNPNFELPDGFTEIPSFGYSEQGLPWRIRGEKSGAVMALVPAGSAHVGSKDGPPETQPEFSPFLEAYYMDVTEVTLEQYQRFRDAMKEKKNTKAEPALNDKQDPQQPALGLLWGQALGFARWAGKELPTEAEFENAARGPEGWRTPWGNGRAIWPHGREIDQITPVASFSTDQSIYGIYDLAGNAREWCSDYYSPTSHAEATQAQSRTLRNWTGAKKGLPGQRVVKGNGPDWSAWHRQGRIHNERHPDVGFRCVLRVKVPQAGESKGD